MHIERLALSYLIFNVKYILKKKHFFELNNWRVNGKKILTKIAWTRVLLMHGNFTYFSITANLKQMLKSMRLEHRSFTHNKSKTSLL